MKIGGVANIQCLYHNKRRTHSRFFPNLNYKRFIMSVIFSHEIDKLKSLLYQQAEKVEEQVQLAAESLSSQGKALADLVVRGEENIDQGDIRLQEDCLKIIALYQPVAIDLRFLVAVLKFNNDLERIGDIATTIAKRTTKLKSLNVDVVFDFNGMVLLARKMLRHAIDALVNIDAQEALKIFDMEKNLNRMHKNNTQVIQEIIQKNPQQAEALIHQLALSRNVERIGDLATNLGEEVIYIAKGEIVRHRNLL